MLQSGLLEAVYPTLSRVHHLCHVVQRLDSDVLGHPSVYPGASSTVHTGHLNLHLLDVVPFFIVHYTKTVVTAFGDDEGWDTEIGLKTEIVPLSKPFGLYAGNVFQGTVKLDGKPVPFAEVEVEYYDKDKKYSEPVLKLWVMFIMVRKNANPTRS